ncbi:MAG: D-tyrosyl-tRNA(Tyr) deacylase [Clostridiales bacterium]|nr:D-tyrosyl-tRNA(Tyr) deacylase [Clostridiales bacterium]
MKAVIQRVRSASLVSEGKTVSEIGKGLFILLGVRDSDSEEDSRLLAAKCSGIRLFEDDRGKMNLSVDDIGGEILVVSNFTLYADCKKGKRPSFTSAARPEKAKPLYESFVRNLDCEKVVKTGIFGADMKISAENDGPVTIIIESEDLRNGN